MRGIRTVGLVLVALALVTTGILAFAYLERADLSDLGLRRVSTTPKRKTD